MFKVYQRKMTSQKTTKNEGRWLPKMRLRRGTLTPNCFEPLQHGSGMQHIVTEGLQSWRLSEKK